MTSAASAADEGSLWSRMMKPRGSTTSSPVYSAKSGTPSQNGQPLWTPANEPTTFGQRMGVVTKRAARGIGTAMFQPISDMKKSKYDTSYMKATQSQPTQKKPAFRLFKKPEPQPSPQTMGEWMMQTRPK